MADDPGGYGRDPSISFAVGICVATFIAISLYNVVELVVIIFCVFKNRHGLYFWSFISATLGIVLWSLGYLIKTFRLARGTLLYSCFIAIGWCLMVTGQSCVLYSRLHLVLHDQTYLRIILGVIIFNAIVLHIPTMTMGFGANSPHPEVWLKLYPIYEKIEVTIFFLQELALSLIYIICTIKFFRDDSAYLGRTLGNTLRRLITINVVVIALDITILVLEYAGYYDVQTAYKGMVYSVKLKLEFSILNELVKTTTRGRIISSCGCNGSQPPHSPGDMPLSPCNNNNNINNNNINVNTNNTSGSGGLVFALFHGSGTG
ncbi:hypothetical protein B0I35DRAFT_406039 [Stachybotrys elegans]|uniref:DUF7703 domain-containing protein n=1 Tax=Stachybotrys elegans TaxID=80388 RepID=A0A8K0SWR9_9HYPO|nr:hypothetical protein B0I35DRAFT_406039 [Stachybotrys elegans]